MPTTLPPPGGNNEPNPPPISQSNPFRQVTFYVLHVDKDRYGKSQIYFYREAKDALETSTGLKERGIDSTMKAVTGQSPYEYWQSLWKESSQFYDEVILDPHINDLKGR